MYQLLSPSGNSLMIKKIARPVIRRESKAAASTLLCFQNLSLLQLDGDETSPYPAEEWPDFIGGSKVFTGTVPVLERCPGMLKLDEKVAI